jgi:hypothetical protein
MEEVAADLARVRRDAARLRECLDLFDAAVAIVDRSTPSLPFVFTNLAMRELIPTEPPSLEGLFSVLGASEAEQTREALERDQSARIGPSVLDNTAIEISVHPLEADLLESVAIVIAPASSTTRTS